MLLISILIFYLFCPALATVTSDVRETSIKLLEKYGYLNTSTNSLKTSDEIAGALTQFQDYFNLDNDGDFNNETLALLNSPRCGVADNPLMDFTVSIKPENRWGHKQLTWYFNRGNYKQMMIAEEVFRTWQRFTTLSFSRSYTRNANIIISFGAQEHNYKSCNNREKCSFDFKDNEGVLGHAYSPHSSKDCVEIHLNLKYSWFYENTSNILPDGYDYSLYQVLLHETGHALGIHHSSDPKSIMYPYFSVDVTTLSTDDIFAIQSLYGRPTSLPVHTTPRKQPVYTPPRNQPTTLTTSTSTTTTTTTTKPTTGLGVQTSIPEFCQIRNKIKTFIILNERLYMVYEKYAWSVNLKTKQFDKPSYNLNNYMQFLPENFTKIIAAYRQSNDDLMLFSKNSYYRILFPSMKLLDSGPISRYDPTNVGIAGAVTTYTGKTYVFYKDGKYIQIRDCDQTTINHGYISTTFKGIPGEIDGVFRYTNGLIYFLQESMFFEYDEFANVLVRIGSIDEFFSSILKIPNCPNVQLIVQLKNLLSKIVSYNVELCNVYE